MEWVGGVPETMGNRGDTKVVDEERVEGIEVETLIETRWMNPFD